MITTSSVCGFAQSSIGGTEGAQQVFNGFLYANAFGGWSVPQGDIGQFAWSQPSTCTNLSGLNFRLFAVGLPITIVDANPTQSEAATITSVSITPSGCSITTTALTHPHFGFRIVSATFGLQEALNYAAQNSLTTTVYLTPAWARLGGTTGMIAVAVGNANIGVVDQRQMIYQSYTWNGSAYVKLGLSGLGISTIDNVPIGGITPAGGAFTTLTANGAMSLTGTDSGAQLITGNKTFNTGTLSLSNINQIGGQPLDVFGTLTVHGNVVADQFSNTNVGAVLLTPGANQSILSGDLYMPTANALGWPDIKMNRAGAGVLNIGGSLTTTGATSSITAGTDFVANASTGNMFLGTSGKLAWNGRSSLDSTSNQAAALHATGAAVPFQDLGFDDGNGNGDHSFHNQTVNPPSFKAAFPGSTYVNTANGKIDHIAVTLGGSAYTTPPTVTVSGGGSGATATATQVGGVITGVSVTAGGTGYVYPPQVSFTGGTPIVGAAAHAVLCDATRHSNDGCALGSVDQVIIDTDSNGVTGGTGYVSTPAVSFSGGTCGSPNGTGCATAVLSANAVVSVTMVDKGSGYQSPPTVSFSGGGGSGASAFSVLSGGDGNTLWVKEVGLGNTTGWKQISAASGVDGNLQYMHNGALTGAPGSSVDSGGNISTAGTFLSGGDIFAGAGSAGNSFFAGKSGGFKVTSRSLMNSTQDQTFILQANDSAAACSGTINTVGTAVTWVSGCSTGDYSGFATDGSWNGVRFTICPSTCTGSNGTDFFIANGGVTDNHHITLKTSAGTQTGVSYVVNTPFIEERFDDGNQSGPHFYVGPGSPQNFKTTFAPSLWISQDIDQSGGRSQSSGTSSTGGTPMYVKNDNMGGNQGWVPYGVPKILTSNASVPSATPVTIFSFPMDGNAGGAQPVGGAGSVSTHTFDCQIIWQGSTTSTTLSLSALTAALAANTYGAEVSIHNNASGGVVDGYVTSSGSGVTGNAAQTANTPYRASFRGSIFQVAIAGNFQIQAASPASGTVTILSPGSYCKFD